MPRRGSIVTSARLRRRRSGDPEPVGGKMLRQIIPVAQRGAVLVGAAIDRGDILEVPMSGRRWDRPFERVGIPGVALGPLPPPYAVDDVGDEGALGEAGGE